MLKICKRKGHTLTYKRNIKKGKCMTTNKLIKSFYNVNYAKIKNIEIDRQNKEIFIYVDLHKTKQRICPYCGKKCKGLLTDRYLL